jgi:hypothetical protein
MQRIPKFTAGMFKKKMKRFGAPAVPGPRLPRIKKYAGGGATEEMENEKNVAKFLNQPETAQEKKARELAKKAEKYAPSKDADQSDDDEDEVVVTPEEGKKQLEADRLKDLEQYMKEQERKRKEKFGLNKPPQTPPKAVPAPYKPGSMKPEVKMKRGGAVSSSASRRADGCAVRGKTKGRFV